jgi:hypothetical protein
METVQEIFDKYDTDKNSSFHNYGRQYDSIFRDFRDKEIKYLEIGVAQGQSILAMREVFKNAKCILGLDIDAECKQYEDVSKNIFVEIGDASNEEFIKKIIEKHGTFDVILDDGSHTNVDVINSFKLLFPLLNDNGVYIVEDIICARIPTFVDPRLFDHLSFFFQFIPNLSQWRESHSTEGIRDNCVDPFKIIKKTDNVYEYSIDKVEFGCSYVAVWKKIRTHWI